MTFALLACRFHFRAAEIISFPAGASGNILRGAFGTILRAVAPPEVFGRLFAPVREGAGPSGLTDSPRPFVFRAAHLDGRTLEEGEPFHFDVHLFEANRPPVEAFRAAFGELAKRGLGPRRGRALLQGEDMEPVTLSLRDCGQRAGLARVHFLTPTELKSEGLTVTAPDFAVLASRIRDRISILRTLYREGPLDLDFAAFGERAARVRLVAHELRHKRAERRSSRTGQTHPIGGFTGWCDYEGELGEFLPYLRAAYYTGVGRHTVWGNGVIRPEVLDSR